MFSSTKTKKGKPQKSDKLQISDIDLGTCSISLKFRWWKLILYCASFRKITWFLLMFPEWCAFQIVGFLGHPVHFRKPELSDQFVQRWVKSQWVFLSDTRGTDRKISHTAHQNRSVPQDALTFHVSPDGPYLYWYCQLSTLGPKHTFYAFQRKHYSS